MVNGLHCGTNRRHEHRGPQPTDRATGQDVGMATPGVRKPDRHVDRHDLDRAVGLRRRDQIPELCGDVRACPVVGQRHAYSASLTGVHPQHPLATHTRMVPSRRIQPEYTPAP